MKERVVVYGILPPTGEPPISFRALEVEADALGLALEEVRAAPEEAEVPAGVDAVLWWLADAAAEEDSLRSLASRLESVPLMAIGVRLGHDDERLEWVGRGLYDVLEEDDASPASVVRMVRLAVARRRGRMDLDDRELASIRREALHSRQQVKDSEALYHSLVENLVQNIFRKDLRGRFTFANTNFCRAIGKELSEVLGKTDFDFFPRDLAAKYQADDHQVIESGKTLEAEEEHETADGERLVVKVVKTPVHNAAGDTVGMQGIFWGITEQKRAQEALVESQERFALAVRGSTDGIWDWDISTNAIYFSSRFKELLGYGEDEFANRFSEWEDRIYSDDRERALAAFENHLRESVPFDEEYRLQCKGGSYRWFRVRGLAVRTREGKATRMAGSISDITTRKEAEAQLRARTADLERSNRDLEQFAYIASHDLKEPLRMVTSYVQLLEHRYKDQLGEDALDFIGFAVDGAKRMKRLIDGLLEFSRVGTRGQDPSPVSAEEVLDESLANLEVLIKETGASVTRDPLPVVLADRVQLGQLLQNLVGNSLKFCTETPRIHVSASPEEGEEGQWRFTVKDNGIGISPEHSEKVFQIYQRLNSRVDYDGTGIGLAVCRKIVERHGGKIWVESELGKGATFFFTLWGSAG